MSRLIREIEPTLDASLGRRNYAIFTYDNCGGVWPTGRGGGGWAWADIQPFYLKEDFYNGTLLHEMFHGFGAVQATAPNYLEIAGFGLGHCSDNWDIMCSPTVIREIAPVCPGWKGMRADCGNDDYFAVTPATGSFLAQNEWANIANSSYLTDDVSPAAGVQRYEVADIVYSPNETGYWVASRWGEVRAENAPHYGGIRAEDLLPFERVAAISPTSSGAGYWVFTNLGRTFAFGDATWYGDLRDVNLAGDIVASAVTPSGLGYYMVGAEGGIFAFGDAAFYGSIQGVVDELVEPGFPAALWLSSPVVGIAPTSTGRGYWLVASDGGIFTFGDASFLGSVPGVLPGVRLDAPVTAMIAQGSGYLLVALDGGIFSFGESRFWGSLGDVEVATQIVAVTSREDLGGYLMVDAVGRTFGFGSSLGTH